MSSSSAVSAIELHRPAARSLAPKPETTPQTNAAGCNSASKPNGSSQAASSGCRRCRHCIHRHTSQRPERHREHQLLHCPPLYCTFLRSLDDPGYADGCWPAGRHHCGPSSDRTGNDSSVRACLTSDFGLRQLQRSAFTTDDGGTSSRDLPSVLDFPRQCGLRTTS